MFISWSQEMTPAMIKHYWTEMLHAVAAIHRSKVIHKVKPLAKMDLFCLNIF